MRSLPTACDKKQFPLGNMLRWPTVPPRRAQHTAEAGIPIVYYRKKRWIAFFSIVCFFLQKNLVERLDSQLTRPGQPLGARQNSRVLLPSPSRYDGLSDVPVTGGVPVTGPWLADGRDACQNQVLLSNEFSVEVANGLWQHLLTGPGFHHMGSTEFATKS